MNSWRQVSEASASESAGLHSARAVHSSSPTVRVVFALIAALALAACPSSGERDTANSGGAEGSGSSVPSPAECSSDAQCLLAGPTCCSCPTFAVPAGDFSATACDGVSCPPATCPENVQAGCVAGRCQLTCAPVACATTCDHGYAADANGCLSCACAVADGCAADADCHDVGADCCGCALGGSDTAVADVAAHAAELGCPAEPQCPGNDTCDPEAAVRCIAARCFLLPAVDQTAPANRCGRPDLHPDPANPAATACPVGSDANNPAEICVINVLGAATAQGTGVCLGAGSAGGGSI